MPRIAVLYGIRTKRIGDLFSTVTSDINAAEHAVGTAEQYASQAQATVNAATGAGSGPQHSGGSYQQQQQQLDPSSTSSSLTKPLLAGGALALFFLWWKRR